MLKFLRVFEVIWIALKQGLNLKKSRAQKFRCGLEALGPIFVKFGQLLSTRVDILSDEFAMELIKLQDQVPPFSNKKAIKIIEKELSQSIDQAFEFFNPEPLASASIAQVYEARSKKGQALAIKILRPNIEKTIKKDFAWIKLMVCFLEAFNKNLKQLKLRNVILELEKTLLDELDLLREAANASQLRRNFENSNLLYVPKIAWEYSTKKMMVSEKITGIPVSNIEALKQAKINLKSLAERGVEIFFTQVFRDCFFHADMHPGNVWVNPVNPDQPQYMALDFGIMGSLSPHDQNYLAENLLAFFNRDYRKVAVLHVESGWIPRNTRIDEFEMAIRTVCEPIFAKPLAEISFGRTLLGLFQTANRFKMEIQPQLILLQKTLIAIEGLGRQLYPALDLWKTAKPFLETWLKSELGHRAFFRKFKANLPYWLAKLPDLPKHLEQQGFRVSEILPIQGDKTSGFTKFLGFVSVFLIGLWIGYKL
ncbi:MAG: ubiquinone biosynthesis regulatory protein kinase UbiB [Gammaproteobacteria bacterium]